MDHPRPAQRAKLGLGKPHLAAGIRRKFGDGARMAVGEGHPHVDHVGNGAEGFFRPRLVEHRMRRGFEIEDGLALDAGADPVDEFRGMRRHQLGKCCLIGPTAATGDDARHLLRPQFVAECDRILRQRDDAHRGQHVFTAQAIGQALAVPALIDLAEVAADVLRQAQPLADAPRHLAMRSQHRLRHGQRLAEALGDGLLLCRRIEIEIEPLEGAGEHLAEFRPVAHVEADELAAECDLVAEQPCEQVGVGVAAHVAQHGEVIDAAAHLGVELRQLRDAHGHDAGLERKIARVAGGEVRGIGQHHHHVGQSE